MPFANQFRVVKRVVVGDTVVLENGERVRLMGVDTPESVDPRRPVQYFGKEATAFTKKMVEGNAPRFAPGFYFLGLTQLQTNQVPEAKQSLTKARNSVRIGYRLV